MVSALHFIFPPGLQMTAEAAEDRRRVVDHVGTVIDLARDLEAPFVVIGGGGMRSASRQSRPMHEAYQDAHESALAYHELESAPDPQEVEL